jgi:hypothetical protein
MESNLLENKKNSNHQVNYFFLSIIKKRKLGID